MLLTAIELLLREALVDSPADALDVEGKRELWKF